MVTRTYIRVKPNENVTIRMYVRIMTLERAYPISLEDRLVETNERVNGALADLFELIVEFDRREAYLVDGARNMADWLSYRMGYSERTARDYHRIAGALVYLPAIANAFREGLLTLDKIRWLTEFCTPDEDEVWAHGHRGRGRSSDGR